MFALHHQFVHSGDGQAGRSLGPSSVNGADLRLPNIEKKPWVTTTTEVLFAALPPGKYSILLSGGIQSAQSEQRRIRQ